MRTPSLPALLLGIAALAAAASPAAEDPPAGLPSLGDHFPDEGVPTHAFLLVDGNTGDPLRTEGPVEEPVPWDGLERLLLGVVGVESGVLDPGRRVPCDSTCWAAGGHGEPDLMEALAFDCDAWAADARERVPAGRVHARAAAHGLLDAEGARRADPEAWTGFWRALTSDRLGLGTAATTTILGAAGMSVTSPRGGARSLHDPRRRTRAFVFAGGDGSWVLGSRTVLGREWVFALHMAGASPALAAARTSRLIEDTRDVARRSSAERGGAPVPD